MLEFVARPADVGRRWRKREGNGRASEATDAFEHRGYGDLVDESNGCSGAWWTEKRWRSRGKSGVRWARLSRGPIATFAFFAQRVSGWWRRRRGGLRRHTGLRVARKRDVFDAGRVAAEDRCEQRSEGGGRGVDGKIRQEQGAIVDRCRHRWGGDANIEVVDWFAF